MRLFTFIKIVGLPAVVLAMTLVSCGRPFDVNVGTDEPIKVDVSMEVHVYQHGEDSPEDKVKRQDYKKVLEQRRGRMEEIQKLKNNRLVGEDHQGLLSIRNLPAGEYGLYVKKTVKEENADRNFLMKAESEQKGKALGDVKKAQWSHWQRKSFPGEWIQVEGDEAGTYRWEQKKGASEDKGKTGAKTGAKAGSDKAAAVGTAKERNPPKK
ncbi:MAG: YdbL family protein [Verrucomicrobiales bacterium]|nr:YdbL family protein [Verrucomicrobiales bacterium]